MNNYPFIKSPLKKKTYVHYCKIKKQLHFPKKKNSSIIKRGTAKIPIPDWYLKLCLI